MHFKNFTSNNWTYFILGIVFLCQSILQFLLYLNDHGISSGITAFLIYSFPAFFLFYLAFKKDNFEETPHPHSSEEVKNVSHKPTKLRFGTKVFMTIFISGIFVLRWLNVLFGRYKNNLEIIVSLPVFYLIVSLIWCKDWRNCSIFRKTVCTFAFIEILILTAFSYEILPTPIVLIVLTADVLLWFIQISIIKKLFFKSKNLYVYWIWNITSPIWTLLINGYKNEGSGSHNYYGFILYVIGAICIVSFVLKKNPFAQEVEEIRKNKLN